MKRTRHNPERQRKWRGRSHKTGQRPRDMLDANRFLEVRTESGALVRDATELMERQMGLDVLGLFQKRGK